MLFQKHLSRLIILGRKTETRRLVKPGEAGAAPTCFYRVGRSYPLERPMRLDEANEFQAAIITRRRGGRPPKKEVGRIRIIDVERGPVGEITFGMAKAEGFDSPLAFKRYWLQLHDKAWPRRETVFCPTCLLDADYPADELPPCPTCGGGGEIPLIPTATDAEAEERFAVRWAETEVWAIRFELEATPIFLAELPHRTGDYVTTEHDARGRQIAMVSESQRVDVISQPGATKPVLERIPEEAVHPEIIDSWATDRSSTHHRIKAEIESQGHTTSVAQRDVIYRLEAFEHRIRSAKAKARMNGRDIASEIKAYRLASERKRTLEHLEHLLRTIERHSEQKEAPRAA